MKKILGIMVMGLLWCNISFADNYKIGQEIENEFRFTKKIKFPLESGTWIVIEKSGWFYGDIKVRLIGIALIENDEIISFREFQEGTLTGSFQSELNTALYEYFYLDKYDGCYQRTEYTLVKKYSKGTSTNCLVVEHMDVNKELYNPDDSKRTHERMNYRKWINNYNIKVPDIMLASWHAYFSRTVSGNLYTVGYYDNPKYFNGPKHKFSTEDTSEYHPSNINKHPKFKKYMDEFVSPDISKRPLLAGTYNGHPVGLAASIATVNFLIDHGTEVYGHLEKLGQQAEDGMNAAFLSKGIKGVVTRLGSAMSFYFMDHLPVDFHDLLLHHDFDRDLAVRRRLVEEGVFVVPVATKQISISSAHTERDIEMLVKKFEECLI